MDHIETAPLKITTMTRDEEIRKEADRRTEKGNEDPLGFEAGAWWADEHPQSPWISPDVKLPDPHEQVLVCVHKEGRSLTIRPRPFEFELNSRFTEAEQSRILRRTRFSNSDFYDKYGFLKHGADVYNVLYWMHIPEAPKGGAK